MKTYIDTGSEMYVLVTGFDFDNIELLTLKTVLKSADGKVEFYGKEYDTETVMANFVNKN